MAATNIKQLKRRAAAPDPSSVVTTTLGGIILAVPALEHLLALALPVPVLYHIGKLLRLARVETTAYEEQRVALIKAHGVEREPTIEERATGATSMFEVPPGQQGAYVEKLRELLAIDVTITARPLTLAELATAAVAGTDLFALDQFVVEEPPCAK
jgi:hypothetical protein